ncbi:MAG: aldo/keto reductase [Haloarculaceae archaeon]
MPPVGLGTYRLTGEPCTQMVARALDLGYRHVDTAEMYGNEAAVGAGLAAADVPREDLFLATKLWHDSLAPGDVAPTAAASREALGVDVLDLLYVHWPAGDYVAGETLPAMAALRDRGLVDHLGVSNFTPALLDEARDVLGAPPAYLQVECHPLLPQERLRAYCERHGIQLVGYAPLARGRVADVPAVRQAAERHDATPAQVSLAWLREKGVAAIPKTADEGHLRENLASTALDLSAADVEAIDAVERRERVVAPSFGPW